MTDTRLPYSGVRDQLHSRRRQKRALIGVSALWMLVWFPIFTYFGSGYNGRAALGLSVIALVTYMVTTVWVAANDRFAEPLVQYSFSVFGQGERRFRFRHVGGTQISIGRIVTKSDYKECVTCSEEFVDGVREDWAQHFVMFGIPIWTYDSKTEFYCSACRPDVWDGDLPTIPTCDLKYPERGSLDMEDALPEIR